MKRSDNKFNKQNSSSNDSYITNIFIKHQYINVENIILVKDFQVLELKNIDIASKKHVRKIKKLLGKINMLFNGITFQ